jgi:hypothetical protein
MTDCCCYYEVDDPAKVFVETLIRKSRAVHECCECGRAIPVGAPYWNASLLYDDSWTRYSTCELCHNIATDRFPCGYGMGMLWETLRECLREYGDADNDWLDPPTEPIIISGRIGSVL